VFGLKPTRGRVPTGPDQGEIWQGAVVEGVISRSVRDSAAMLDAISGDDPGSPYSASPPARPFSDEVATEPARLRIAFTAEPFLGHSVHDDCRRALADTVALLEGLGHTLVEATPPVQRETFNRAFLTMVCGELSADIADAERQTGRKASRANVEYATWALHLLGRTIPAAEYASANRTLARAARETGAFFEPYDVLLTPTLSMPPFVIGELQPPSHERIALKVLGALHAGSVLSRLGVLDQAAEKVFDFIPYTPLANITGQPAMSVPLCWNEAGLPIGMHFTAKYGDEATLFRLAGQLERARPWFDRLPSLARE
jgi:amidase